MVKVKVLSADPKAKRIGLSMKALQEPGLPPVKHGARRSIAGQAPAATSEARCDVSPAPANSRRELRGLLGITEFDPPDGRLAI